MQNFIKKVKEFFGGVKDFFTSLFRPRRRSYRRSSSRRGGRGAYSHNKRKLTFGDFMNKTAAFFKKLAADFSRWISKFERKVVYGFAGGASIAIITIVVVLSVLITPFASAETGSDKIGGNDNAGVSQLTAVTTEAPENEAASKTAEDIVIVTYENGTEDTYVTVIQERLMELNYMGDDLPTELYGETTTQAVTYFQRKNDLKMTGKADPVTLAKLFSTGALQYTVSKGDDGYDVTELQSRLVELGYIEKITGHFGDETEEAVKRFQEKNDLVADGKVGESTMEMLYSEDATANFLSFGEKSDTVKKYQQKLKQLGYLSSEPDGTYGNDTVSAVKRFQTLNGLIADGFLGPTTKELLDKGTGKANALMLGVSGDDVVKMQRRLIELKYMWSATGYFGSDTENAIRNFQRRNGLTVDGKAGINTLNVLYSSSARKASTTGSSSGGSSSGSSSGGSSSSRPSGGSSSSGSSGNKVTYNKSVSSLISVAKSKLGCRYILGAKGPNAFDCSGFVYYCLNQIGVNQSYWTSSTWRGNGKYQKISSIGSIKAGDIVVFGNGLNHVGIALGGGMMIDASSGDGRIRITDLSKSYWQRHFYGAYRVLG